MLPTYKVFANNVSFVRKIANMGNWTQSSTFLARDIYGLQVNQRKSEHDIGHRHEDVSWQQNLKKMYKMLFCWTIIVNNMCQ